MASMSDELKERKILKLILIVRFARATLDVGHPILRLSPHDFCSTEFAFFKLVIGICEIVSKIGDRPKEFLEAIFLLLMELVENEILHSAFRSFTSTFYSNLFNSTVWAAFILGVQFEIGWFVFLTYE
jgi:hypothetical protein